MTYPRLSRFTTAQAFQKRLEELDLDLPFEDQVETGAAAPLAKPLPCQAGEIGNRFCILPMEGWDGTTDGRPTELTRRRWRNFGESGAKLIWGGEAVAVRPDGRANPHQLMLTDESLEDIGSLRTDLLTAHEAKFGDSSDLLLGLQLTHSGRFARPADKRRLEPRTVYRHPLLDPRFGADDQSLLSDEELWRLIDDFVAAAVRAHQIGFTFVDIKHCHGYLGHELLSGFDRPGDFGGSLENRTRFLREIVQRIRRQAPGLHIGVRISIFDFVPFEPGADGIGVPACDGAYPYAFGGDGSGEGIDLNEPLALMELLEQLGIELACSTVGSPYYNPHIQRPALFPPSDGYQPPEDPLIGVHRQISVTAQIKSQCPRMLLVGSGYSYLQEWLPNVGQAVIRHQMADAIGLGRMVLSYPDLPADVLAGRPLTRKRICRTFSDCTTAPRNGLVSGCYPLDPFYKAREESQQLKQLKDKRPLPPL